MNTNTNKGVWMPTEILKIQNISLDEKVLLSIYRYYTVEGNTHCCCLTNDAICAMIGVNERKLQRMKAKLKSLGYITFNGGIRVWYRGDNSDTLGVTNLVVGGDNSDTLGVTNLVVGGDKSDTLGVTNLTPKIKKEKRQNKDFNKEYNLSISEVTYDSDKYFMEKYGVSEFIYSLLYHDDVTDLISYINDKNLWDREHVETVESHLEGDELYSFQLYMKNTNKQNLLHA